MSPPYSYSSDPVLQAAFNDTVHRFFELWTQNEDNARERLDRRRRQLLGLGVVIGHRSDVLILDDPIREHCSTV